LAFLVGEFFNFNLALLAADSAVLNWLFILEWKKLTPIWVLFLAHDKKIFYSSNLADIWKILEPGFNGGMIPSKLIIRKLN
jgi:hypothetical protein